MNYLDLFSGIGGFALGAHMAGMKFDKHYFSEIDPYCVELYQKRFPDAIPLGDIKEIDCAKLADTTSRHAWSGAEQLQGEKPIDWQSALVLPDASRGSRATEAGSDNWLITGGFPCQDISVAGKGAGIRASRSGLWFEYWRIIRDLRPRYAIMENVGAITFRGLDVVLGSLAEIGYGAEWQDIRAEDVGAPHRRERIWIVAYPAGGGWSEAELRRCEPSGIAGEATERTDPDSTGFEERRRPEPVREEQPAAEHIREGESIRSNREVPDAQGQPIGTGLCEDEPAKQRGRRSGNIDSQAGDWWSTEPDVGRLAHGIRNRVDRLRGLGNAIVPQIAAMLFRQIMESHE